MASEAFQKFDLRLGQVFKLGISGDQSIPSLHNDY